MLLRRISPQRLAVYLEATDDDLSRAIALYAWNSQVSAALFEVFGHVEVVLRNAIHEHMTTWSQANGFGDNWFLNHHGLLGEKSVRAIRRVAVNMARAGAPSTVDRFVTGLGFGFWRFILTSRYKPTIWAQVLHEAFPNVGPLEVDRHFARVGRIHGMRNRVAHHEPVLHRRVDLAAQDAYLAIGAVCRQTEEWVRKTSRVENILRTRPQ